MHSKNSVYLSYSVVYWCGLFYSYCSGLIRSLRWRHNGHDGISNHQPHDCLLNRLFRCWLKKTPKLRVTGLCAGNSPGTGEFPAQMARNAENVSTSWHQHKEFGWIWLNRWHVSVRNYDSMMMSWHRNASNIRVTLLGELSVTTGFSLQ